MSLKILTFQRNKHGIKLKYKTFFKTKNIVRSEHTCDSQVLSEQRLRNALDLSNDLVITKILCHLLVPSTFTSRNDLKLAS